MAAVLDYSRTSRNGSSVLKTDPGDLPRQNWNRYEYGKQRGHLEYCEKARRYEEYYLGGGLQYLPGDRDKLESEGRLPVELNEIADAVNTALGYQINNRADISFKPRGQGASEQVAKTLSQVAMQIADNNRLPWLESQMFADGLIQRRGYIEIRIAFDDSMKGEVRLGDLDPLDVIPDPDAKGYDPDTWADVIISRWLTLEEVEVIYGTKARRKIEQRMGPMLNERDFGDDMDETPRNTFGDPDSLDTVFDAYFAEGGIQRVRIIDRQYWKMVLTMCVIYPTGDIRIAENSTPKQRAQWRQQGCITVRRPMKRVRWCVTTCDDVLFDDWSPMTHFSVIPYFPYFRRGKTKGLIDDAVGPQDMLNKTMTAFTQIVSGAANSGWIVEENSLANMDTDDLERDGGKNGLVIEFRKTAKNPPAKIKPNPVPSGVAELAKIASDKIKQITGQTDAMSGEKGTDPSGIAVQSMQYAAQMSLTIPLDNLARSRHLLAMRMLELVQTFYDDARMFRITATDPGTGRESSQELFINWVNQNGQKDNDLTVGEYDVVITEQPTQITYNNSQFQQALAMKKEGVALPDNVLVKYSTLQDKPDIIDQMNNAPKSNPLDDAKATLLTAQAALAQATAVSKNVEALFSAIRTGQILLTMPGTASLADEVAKSAGFVDKNPAPLFPSPGAPAPGPASEAAAQATPGAAAGVQPPPNNTNPATPDNPQRGMDAGIENGTAAGPTPPVTAGA